MQAKKIQIELESMGDSDIASHATRFFKTGPGEYGEGDLFRGIRVPPLRKLAKKYSGLTIGETEKLLRSPYHEDRLLALIILVNKYKTGDATLQSEVYASYLNHLDQVNNWDLVDSSAHWIIGPHLPEGERSLLDRLAGSSDLWRRRVAIIATLHYIKQHAFEDTLRISDMLLEDEEDLIHKAVGWMLREVGKRDMQAEMLFLQPRYKRMPRTMLRYAIEKFPGSLRQDYLQGRV